MAQTIEPGLNWSGSIFAKDYSGKHLTEFNNMLSVVLDYNHNIMSGIEENKESWQKEDCVDLTPVWKKSQL